MIVKRMKQSADFKKTKSEHCRDLIKYILTARKEDIETPEKLLCAGCVNMLESDATKINEVIAEQTALAYESERSKNPLLHYVLSVETVDNEKINEKTSKYIAETFLKELGVSDLTAVYGVHDDKDNRHIHICINKIHPETHKSVEISKGFDIKAAHRAAAVISRDLELGHVKNALYISQNGEIIKNPDHQKGVSDNGRQEEAQRGECSNERICRAQKETMLSATSWTDLHSKLAENGVHYIKLRAGGAKVRRGSFYMKASDIHRDCSIKNMEKRLGPYQAPARPALEKIEKQQDKPVKFHDLFKNLDIFSLLFILILILLRVVRIQKNEQKENYKKQQEELKQQNWKGKGKELNAMRQVLAQENREKQAEIKSKFVGKCKELKSFCKENEHNKDTQEHICDEIMLYGDYDERDFAAKYKKEQLKIIDRDSLYFVKGETERVKTNFERVTTALEAEKYLVYSKVNENEGKKNAQSGILKNRNGNIAFSSTELEEQCLDIAEKNYDDHCGIMLHPKSDRYFYIVVDDLNQKNLEKMRENMAVALAYTTSPGNYQAVIKINKIKELSENIQKNAAIKTARELAEKYHGDLGGVGAERTLRMPGTTNFKNKYIEKDEYHCCDVVHSSSETCKKTQQSFEQYIEQEKARPAQAPAPARGQEAAPVLTAEQGTNLYNVFQRDLHIKMRNLSNDDNRFYIAKRLVALGYTNEQVCDTLMNGAQKYTPESSKLNDFRYFERIAQRARDAENGKPAPENMRRLWKNQAEQAKSGKTAEQIERKKTDRERE